MRSVSIVEAIRWFVGARQKVSQSMRSVHETRLNQSARNEVINTSRKSWRMLGRLREIVDDICKEKRDMWLTRGKISIDGAKPVPS
jgi:hypothetical protein